MATYDPVLDRKMFKAKEKPSKVKGIADLGEEEMVDIVDESDYEARREMAMKMLAAAREKQNPSNFNTLSETERPMVFRPAAVNLPQPQQPVPAAQQMAQMQAAGIRPAGMAHGGIVRHGYHEAGLVSPSGPVGLESLHNITSEERRRLSPEDNEAIEKAQAAEFNLRTFDPENDPKNLMTDPDTGQTPEEKEDLRLAMKGKVPYDPYQLEGGLNDAVTYNRPEDPSTWTPDFKEAMIDKIYKDRKAERATVDPSFQSYVKELTREDIAKEITSKAADINLSQRNTYAKKDADARERAMSNVALGEGRDYAGDRLGDTLVRAADDRVEKAQQKGRLEASSMETSRREEGVASLGRIAEDQALRDQAMPDKRDYAQGREGLASLGRIAEDQALRDQAMPDKRDYAQERKAATIPGVPGAGVAKDQAGAGAGADGPAVAQEPAKYAPSTTLESIKSDRAKEREDNFNLSLIQAGLAIMGGKSPNAFTNIGEGGMQGIKQFSEGQTEINRGYREDVKGFRDEERFGRTYDQNERMQGAQIQATSDLARATREGTAEQSRLALASTERMFSRTEDRLDNARKDEFNLSTQGMQLKQAAQELDEKVRTGQLGLGEATLQYQKLNDELTRKHDTEKMEFVAKQPPDSVKMYTALGNGDLMKGYYIVQDAAMHSDRVRAAQNILNPMSGASEEEKQEALGVLSQLMRTGQSVTGGFTYSGTTPKVP